MFRDEELRKSIAGHTPANIQPPGRIDDLDRPHVHASLLGQFSRSRGGLSPRALRRIKDYIFSNLEGKISNNALALVAGLSVFHFARAFKQSLGLTPHRYVLQCRVLKAQILLAETGTPLAKIAVAVGFSDQSHCTRWFRQLLGTTPGLYRWSIGEGESHSVVPQVTVDFGQEIAADRHWLELAVLGRTQPASHTGRLRADDGDAVDRNRSQESMLAK